VGEKPYKKNSPIAPDFQPWQDKDLATEKKRLIDFIGVMDKIVGNLGSFFSSGQNSWCFFLLLFSWL